MAAASVRSSRTTIGRSSAWPPTSGTSSRCSPDVRIEDAWGGPIDITADRFPEIGSTHGGRVLYAHGFAGNGVGPARLAGRILAARIAGGGDPIAFLPLVGRRQRCPATRAVPLDRRTGHSRSPHPAGRCAGTLVAGRAS